MRSIQQKQQSNSANFLQNLKLTTKCVCLEDYRRLAEKVLPPQIFHYIDQGADEEITIRQNSKAFQRIVLFPRVLRDGHGLNLKSKLFGKECSAPLGFAPWAINQIMNRQLGEKGPTMIAGKYCLPYILSTLSNTHPKQITKLNPTGIKMMQLYLCRDWEMNLNFIKIAEQSQFDGIVITVDAQVLGARRKEEMFPLDKTKYQFPILEEMSRKMANGPTKPKANLENRDLSLNWETIRKIRKITKLKIILKGILHPADAAIAVDYCDAIYVSNHGGRQLDTVPSTISVLPKIVSAVRNKNTQIPILIDGGIRTGNDIFKCLALGANFVFIARPVAFALVKGAEGVDQMVRTLLEELSRCMILNGVKSISDISSEYIGYRSSL